MRVQSHGFESPNCHNTFDIRPDTLTMMLSHNNCWTHGPSTKESFPHLVFAACIRASRKTHKSCSQPDRSCPCRNPEGRRRWSQPKPRISLGINLSSTCKDLQAQSQCFICLDMLAVADERNSSCPGESGRWLSRWRRRTKSPGQDLSILISWCIYVFWHADILVRIAKHALRRYSWQCHLSWQQKIMPLRRKWAEARWLPVWVMGNHWNTAIMQMYETQITRDLPSGMLTWNSWNPKMEVWKFGSLEDDFTFQRGNFQVPCLFRTIPAWPGSWGWGGGR